MKCQVDLTFGGEISVRDLAIDPSNNLRQNHNAKRYDQPRINIMTNTLKYNTGDQCGGPSKKRNTTCEQSMTLFAFVPVRFFPDKSHIHKIGEYEHDDEEHKCRFRHQKTSWI